MINENWKNAIKENGLIMLLFIILTLLLTYPVVTRLTTYASGIGTDGFAFKGTIWHINQTLTEGGGISELYHTNYRSYPQGANLEWHTLTLTNTLFLAFPLTLVTSNLVLIYNLLFLFNFIMAGYTMYLLIKYLVKDRATAFLTGFAYTFSPLHMAWGRGFLNLMSFCWTPLFFLFFFKMFEEEKIKNAILAAIFLFFLALASWYHLLFAFLIAVPYFIYKLITARYLFTRQFLIRITLFLALFFIIILPFIVPLISTYYKNQVFTYNIKEEGISPFDYFLPSTFHPLWGKYIKDSCPMEGVVALGYLVIIISLLYLIKKRKNIFWLLLTILFLFFSLNIQGVTEFFRNYVPFANMVGLMSRFSFGVMFSLLIFFAFALEYLLSKFNQRTIKAVAVIIISFALIVEYFAIPYPTTYENKKELVDFAESIGKAVKGPHPILHSDFTVLDFPPYFGWMDYNLYLQSFHKKPIIGGKTSRTIRKDGEALQVRQELYGVIRTNDIDKFQQFLEKYKVGYIIFYDDRYVIYLDIESVNNLMRGINISSFIQSTSLRLLPEATNGKDIGIYIYEVLIEKNK